MPPYPTLTDKKTLIFQSSVQKLQVSTLVSQAKLQTISVQVKRCPAKRNQSASTIASIKITMLKILKYRGQRIRTRLHWLIVAFKTRDISCKSKTSFINRISTHPRAVVEAQTINNRFLTNRTSNLLE